MRWSVFVIAFSMGALGATGVSAQSWSSPRGRPALWQIASVDATGEPSWPYGDEDIAGDGAAAFDDDEAGADLRTVYADSDADRLWLRAYVTSDSAPSESVVAYFFLDTDARNTTGGDAASSELWPELEADLSMGGYERAIAAGGDGELVGAWQWAAQTGQWQEITTQPDEIRVEVDTDIDPIRIGADERGYIQVDIDHAISTLDSSCDGNLFVRIRHEDPPQRAFGDDDDEPWSCRSPLDALDDPIVLREPACTTDADCPADGDCVDGVCLFTYECTGDADCPTGERCSGGACVRVVDEDCTSDAMCDGLVCDDGSCTTCTASGARACEDGLACSPDGSCVNTDDPGGGRGGTGGAGGAGGAAGDMVPPGNVQGGAFHCAATLPIGAPAASGWALLLVLAVLRRARARGSRKGERV